MSWHDVGPLPPGVLQALENETAKMIARKERERLKLQDRLRREQLEKFREQQNEKAEEGEVRTAFCFCFSAVRSSREQQSEEVEEGVGEAAFPRFFAAVFAVPVLAHL